MYFCLCVLGDNLYIDILEKYKEPLLNITLPYSKDIIFKSLIKLHTVHTRRFGRTVTRLPICGEVNGMRGVKSSKTREDAFCNCLDTLICLFIMTCYRTSGVDSEVLPQAVTFRNTCRSDGVVFLFLVTFADLRDTLRVVEHALDSVVTGGIVA